MKKKFFTGLAMLAILAGVVLAGCGGGGSSTGSGPAPSSPSGTVEGNAK